MRQCLRPPSLFRFQPTGSLSMLLALCASMMLLAGCGAHAENELAAEKASRTSSRGERDTISQVSTLEALSAGLYEGFMSVAEIQQLGDFGLGTFEHLEGEMVQLNGRIYQVRDDGQVYAVTESAVSPFFLTTFFDRDRTLQLDRFESLRDLEGLLDERRRSSSLPLAIRIEGTFDRLTTRSVPAQEPPYATLAEVVQNQKVFHFENIEASLVGFWLPSYLSGINASGYHFHALSRGRDGGGHVLDVSGRSLVAEIDESATVKVVLPSEFESFRVFESEP